MSSSESTDGTSESGDDAFAGHLEIAVGAQEKNNNLVHCFKVFGTYHYNKFLNKAPRRQPEISGYDWVISTLNNPRACYKIFRMTRPVFDSLHDTLTNYYGLRSSTGMNSIECLGLFLWTLGGPQSISQVENRFERSTKTIFRKLTEVLICVNRLAMDIIKPRAAEFGHIHPRLLDHRFSPCFNNYIGAIDGTHIPMTVPATEVVAHVGRYRYTIQNVLAICDFDMRFTFVVAGWPGSVHDTRVFNDALQKYADDFPYPPTGEKKLLIHFNILSSSLFVTVESACSGKFYLVDSGYPN